MKHALILTAALAALLPVTAATQPSSYSGQESREIKTLSAEEIGQFQSGAGMGFARAAELNRFPGPMHVLELAKPLALTPEQRAGTRKLMDAHKAEARAIGAKLVEAERALDRLFAGGKVEAAVLAANVKAIGTLQGEYRLSHLETHRRMRAMLTDEQVQRYVQLRGYGGGGSSETSQHGKRHH